MLETHRGAQVFRRKSPCPSYVAPGPLAATAAGRWRWLIAGTPVVASRATAGVGVDGRRSRQERTQDRENDDDPLEPSHLIPSSCDPILLVAKSRNGRLALTTLTRSQSGRLPALAVKPHRSTYAVASPPVPGTEPGRAGLAEVQSEVARPIWTRAFHRPYVMSPAVNSGTRVPAANRARRRRRRPLAIECSRATLAGTKEDASLDSW